ncbi:tigger transposable element-derived protein 1-like [Erythrolamprus reginae]|uniref:tigger transposable element-derived protein 1-like n=1 Tax=Erythrolamprus reginae TaxID=121349 RepID=UPI00396C800C
MEEQWLEGPREEEDKEEGTESGSGDPFINQMRALEDLTWDRTSILNSELMHQSWDSQWQEFVEPVAWLPIPPPPLGGNGTDSQASLGRDKTDPQQESSGEARKESVLQGDPNIGGKTWMGREQLDSSMKMKTQGEINLQSLLLLPLSSQDAEDPQKMSSKRKNPNPTETRRKHHRTSIALNLKMKMIKAYEAGKRIHEIAKEEDLCFSTVQRILKSKERIRKAWKRAAGMNRNITKIIKSQSSEIEPLLILWIKDRIQKGLPVNFPLIQIKAHSIFRMLKEQAGKECTEKFRASQDWFLHFQQRYCYQIPSYEDLQDETWIATHFLDKIDAFIAEGNYSADQIFRVDEIGLYWKRILEQTYIHKEAQEMPSCKAFKERVTVLLGGNVAGFKLKPFFILKSDHASMIQKRDKDTLPVYYRFACEAWMTPILFEDWFMNCFRPQVKEYCGQKGIPFKILLFLNKIPRYVLDLDSIYPNVKVVYLPRIVTTILQPMGQRAILLFSAYYLHAVFAKALAATEDDKITLAKFWNSYNILNCIENIVAAWADFSVKSMQAFLKCLKCFKAFANNFKGFSYKHNSDKIHEKILTLTKSLQLKVEAKDVKNLIAYIEGELSDQDLIELEKELEAQKVREEDAEIEREKEEQAVDVEFKTFTEEELDDILSGVETILSDFKTVDSDEESFRNVNLDMCKNLKCYHKIHERKEKENEDIETKLPSLLPFPFSGIKHPNNLQPSTSYASRSDVSENNKKHEPFTDGVSDLMLRGFPNYGGYDANISEIRERGLERCLGEASQGEANSLECDIWQTHKEKIFHVGSSEVREEEHTSFKQQGIQPSIVQITPQNLTAPPFNTKPQPIEYCLETDELTWFDVQF